MLTLVLFGEYLCHHIGGAEKSTYLLTRRLQRNPDLRVIPVSGICEEYLATRERVPYENASEIPIAKLRFRLPFLQYWLNARAVAPRFRGTQADILFANAQAAPMAINAFDGPSVYFIHDEMSLNVYRTYDRRLWKRLKFAGRWLVDLPFMLHYRRENREAMRRAGLVVANSNYMARRAEELMGVRPEVVYPQVDVQSLAQVELPPVEERQFIMMVGDSEVKGVGTFARIAAAMPDQRFLAVGRGYAEREEDNVAFRGFAADPLTHYRRARLVLLPSTWEEGFGMVSVEAGALGIPAIVSDRGGLPETVRSPDQVVSDYRNTEEWVKTIRRVLGDYDRYSSEARNHAASFDGGRQAERLVDRVRDATGVDLWEGIDEGTARE